MKLNPPETAPKDGTVFLVCLDVSTPGFHDLEFHTAFYEPAHDVILYSYADIDDYFIDDEQKDGCRTFHTDNCTGSKEFIGWLPMPKVDGNEVVFCS